MPFKVKGLFGVLLISILFFVLGQVFYTALFMLFEPHIDGIPFKITDGKGLVGTSILFSLFLALIPLFIAGIWRFAPVLSGYRRFETVLLILLSIFIGVFLRRMEIRQYFLKVVRPYLAARNKWGTIYPIDPAHIVYYMAAGLGIGCILSFLFFRQSKGGSTT